MRLSSAATLALAAAPAVVSAAKGSMGFSLGMKMPNGDCKSQSDYEADFDAIKEASGATIVRGYAVSECEGMGKNILSAAEKKNFKVVLGIWPDAKGSPSNDLNAILEVADKYKDNIYAVTVGSEHLYRKDFTGDQLKDIIVSVREKLPKGIKVGTADSWNKFYDGTANPILDSVDILLINAFAFWQGAGGANATNVYFDDMYKAITHIEQQVGSKDKIEIWNGETGWPTAVGTDYGDAKGGLKNAETFYKNGFCALVDWGYNAFFFEAFDEPWKPDATGDNGKVASEKTWGAMTADRKKKYSLQC